MFTGIVTAVGRVEEAAEGRLRIVCPYPADSLAVGGSIACDGCCLTVTGAEPADEGSLFSVDVSNETLARTTLGQWRRGRAVNLERPLRLMDELGGHMVQGHVDGVATIVARKADGRSARFVVDCPPELAGLIAPKGAVALDGTSLTVNAVAVARFDVNVIPHTLEATTWGGKAPGDNLNLEVDLLARYVARIVDHGER